jgi:hypothetical protein
VLVLQVLLLLHALLNLPYLILEVYLYYWLLRLMLMLILLQM